MFFIILLVLIITLKIIIITIIGGVEVVVIARIRIILFSQNIIYIPNNIFLFINV